MKSNYLVIYIVAFFIAWSCTSPGSNNGTSDSNDGGGPITHTLDTAVGYCFQLFEDGIGEGLEIKIQGNKIIAQGKRVYMNNQSVYNLTIQGVLDGNSAEVDIQVVDSRGKQKSSSHREIWEIGEDFLMVKGRNIKDLEGDYKFYRVNCQRQPNGDVDRYDSFGGFDDEEYAVVSKNGKYGVVNKNNELTVSLSYRDIGDIEEGMASFFDEHIGLYGLLDVSNGKMLIEPKYIELMGFSDGLAAFLSEEEGKWGFINTDLEVVIKPRFLNVNFYKPDPNRKAFNEGLANVETEQGVWNFIDKKGAIVIAGNFSHTKAFQNGEAEVYKDNKWYFINKAGKCIKNCD